MTRDYVGISSENVREKRTHRKSKVSWGRLIRPGLVGPKLRPYGVSDGQSVNIRIPALWRYYPEYDAEGTGVRSVGCLRFLLRDQAKGPDGLPSGKFSDSMPPRKVLWEVMELTVP